MSSNQQYRSTAKDYLAKYDGPKMPMKITLGTPVIKQLFKRDSQIFARNALFITFFARLAFDDKIIDPLEDALDLKIKKVMKKFEDKIVHAQALMRDNGLDEAAKCENNLPVQFDLAITSPLFRRMIDLMVKADDLINYYDTLWMNGLVKSPVYNELRFEVKKDLRGVVAFVRNTWINLQKRVQTDRAGKLTAAIGEMGGDDAGAGDQQLEDVGDASAEAAAPGAEVAAPAAPAKARAKKADKDKAKPDLVSAASAA